MVYDIIKGFFNKGKINYLIKILKISIFIRPIHGTLPPLNIMIMRALHINYPAVLIL